MSKQNKFIFINGRKVAGKSLEVLLSAICGPEDIITPITPIDEQYRVLTGQRAAQNYGVSEDENNAYLNLLKTISKKSVQN